MFTRLTLISALGSARIAVALTVLLTAVLALVSFVSPALAASGPAFTVIGPTQKIQPEGPGPSGAPSAQLLGARNEFVSFQVVIHGGPANNVKLALGKALTGVGGTIPAVNVTIYREEYYTTTTASTGVRPTGRWPDALIPSVDPLYNEKRPGFPIKVLPAGENRVFWVDVLVPEAQHAGFYDGELVLSADSLEDRHIPVHLDVRNLTLPSTSSLTSLFKIHSDYPCQAVYPKCGRQADNTTDPKWTEKYKDLCKGEGLTPEVCGKKVGWSTNHDYARIALDNRITIANSQFQRPAITETIDDNVEKYQLPLFDGTADTRLSGARTTTFAVPNAVSSEAWKKQAVLGKFTAQSVLYTPECDEPAAKNRLRGVSCESAVDAAHEKWPGLPNVVTASIQDVDNADFRGYTDVIAPVMEQMHKPKTPQMPEMPFPGNRRKYDTFLNPPEKRLWMYTSCMAADCIGESPEGNKNTPDWEGWVDYTIDAAASQNRAMGWLAYLYDVSGELYYGVDQDLQTAWTDQWEAGGNGDGTLFYPWNKDLVGGKTPIPIESMRLKLIRNGHQDYEYLKLGSAAGHKLEVDQIAQKLYPSTFDTIATDAEVDAARRKLALLAEPGRVTPVGSLSITPTAPTAKSAVTASFTVTNDGGAPMKIDYLLTGVRDSAGKKVGFPSRVPPTLQPGEQYTYKVTAPNGFDPGTYTAWAAYHDGKEWPRLSQQVTFTVK